MDFINNKLYLLIILLLTFSCSQTNNKNAIPESSRQMVLVLTDSTTATKGTLYYFNRSEVDSAWILSSRKIPVVLGRNGLGWGKGLQKSQNTFDFPFKEEGDGRSPREYSD